MSRCHYLDGWMVFGISACLNYIENIAALRSEVFRIAQVFRLAVAHMADDQQRSKRALSDRVWPGAKRQQQQHLEAEAMDLEGARVEEGRLDRRSRPTLAEA